MPDLAEPVAQIILACNNYECRIKTFVGTRVFPLVSCPVCQRMGIHYEGGGL